MGVKVGSFTPAVTGNISVTGLSFLPDEIVFRLGSATGSVDTTVLRRCDGWTTANNQSYDSWFRDSTGTYQKAATDKCITHYDRVSGTVTPVVEATFVSFDTIIPGSNYGFTLNFTAVNANYQVRYKARG